MSPCGALSVPLRKISAGWIKTGSRCIANSHENVMGTQERKTREKEARRQLILTAANRMLSEKGFMQMTMEDVAREAELSTGLLYFYFKGKDEILVTLLLNSIQYLNDRLRQVRDQDGVTLQEKMKQLEDTFKDLLAFDPSVFYKIIHLHSSRNMDKLSFSLI